MVEGVNAVGWFEIYVDDLDRASTFYKNVLKFDDYIDLSNEHLKMLAFPWVDGAVYASGALVKAEGVKAGIGGTLVYFQCDDCAEEESRVIENGGTIERPKYDLGQYGFCTIILDTEGNRIGLHSKK